MGVGLKTMGQSEENRWYSALLNVLLVNDKSMPGQPCFCQIIQKLTAAMADRHMRRSACWKAGESEVICLHGGLHLCRLALCMDSGIHLPMCQYLIKYPIIRYNL